jgi:phage shock protein PspC (stress-responsive transcriptional regulator)
MNTNAMTAMMNAGPLFGVTGGVAALAAIPNAEAKLFTCAVMFAVAAGSAMRKYLFAAPVTPKMELGDYPFSAHTANPWERDGGPAGL